MFAGIYGGFIGKSECGDFKFTGVAYTPAIPVILKSPYSDFHCNICREFDFTGTDRNFVDIFLQVEIYLALVANI